MAGDLVLGCRLKSRDPRPDQTIILVIFKRHNVGDQKRHVAR